MAWILSTSVPAIPPNMKQADCLRLSGKLLRLSSSTTPENSGFPSGLTLLAFWEIWPEMMAGMSMNAHCTKKALTSEVVTLVSGCLYEAMLENNLCPQNSWNSSGWLERSDKRKETKFYDQQ